MPGYNIGIDLGTANITAFVSGRGIVLSEENAICYDANTKEFIALGNEAGAMVGKAPDCYILKKPVNGGVISDFTVMSEILSRLIAKICKKSIFRPDVVISAPSCTTKLERKAVIEAACAAGAGKVHLVDEPIVAALGAGLSIDHPRGTMVIDVGAGTVDIAVITMGTVAYSVSLKTAGDAMDEAIRRFAKKDKNVLIGKQTARKIKHTIGCAIKREELFEYICTGKDALSGMPRHFSVTSGEICKAISECTEAIYEGIIDVLEQLPAELYTDICHEGIILTGAGAKLYALDKFLENRLSLKVKVAPDPEHCSAKGAGYIIKNMKKLEDNGYYFRLKDRIYAY